MKARTLFFVILFPNIYKQRHLFAFYNTSNGFLQKRARTVVKLCHDLLPGFNKKKLTTITADTGKEMSVEKMNDDISLPNRSEFENPDFKNPVAGYSSFHIKFRQNLPEKNIAETTLIKTYLYE